MGRPRALLGLGGLLAVALAACSPGADPDERVAAAAEATSGAGTARTEMRVVVDSEQAGAPQLMLQAHGEVDFDADRASMELDVPGIPEALHTVVDGAVTYTRVPGELAGGEAGWIRREAPGGGLGLGPGVGVAGEHPARMLAAVSDAADDVAELGSGEIHDTDVDGFEVTIRGGDLAADDEVPPAFAELAIPVEAWLDDADRARELVASFDLATVMTSAARDAPAADGTLRLMLELSDFGADTDIRVPADDEVLDTDAVDELFADP